MVAGSRLDKDDLRAMRSAQRQGSQAFNLANNTANQANANAQGERSQLVPQLEREMENPSGFTPEELNNMTVASQQGAGGALSSLKGDAESRMARTRNSAGYSTALDEAAREKMRTESQNNLNVQNANARLAQEKQQRAESQLGDIYGTDVRETLGAQGLMPEDINAEVNAGKSGWFQNMTDLITTLGKGAAGLASLRGGG